MTGPAAGADRARGSGSVVTWRAQMVLLSVQGMDAGAIAKVTPTSEDRVRWLAQQRYPGRTGSRKAMR
jgi:hypothetical protein